MRPDAQRIYHDPLHGAIVLDSSDPTEKLLIHLIDTPAFQRLRRIRQLGVAHLTFHGAESSRFTHSLGVMSVTRRAFDRLARRYAELKPYRSAVLCAALLHDIGHGPFSHTSEEIFGNHHELWTERIIKEDDEVHRLLSGFAPDLIDQMCLIYNQQHPLPIVWQLVSSQLDCDRLDYLMRDSHSTGASYGKLDLDRILLAMDFDRASQQLVVSRKGMAAIEHYLIVRYFMYAQVYNHPKNLAASWILDQIFGVARTLTATGHLECDATLQAWLLQDCNRLPLHHYLQADDIVLIYHIQQWQASKHLLLADLCRRLINRDLFKTVDISDFSQPVQDDILELVHQWLHQQGLCQSYAGLRVSVSSGYTLYQRGIKVTTPHGLQEISHLSPLVKTLTQQIQQVWLIYPREVEELLVAQLQTLRQTVE